MITRQETEIELGGVLFRVRSRLEDGEVNLDLTGVAAGRAEGAVVCEGHLRGTAETANGAIAALAAGMAQHVEPPAVNPLILAERMKHPNAYLPWTPEDDAALLAARAKGVSIEGLMKEFGRGPGAITARLWKLGVQ